MPACHSTSRPATCTGVATVGRKVGRALVSGGCHVNPPELNAMDGVDLLYAGARSIVPVAGQRHRRARRAPTARCEGDRIGLTLVHNRVLDGASTSAGSPVALC